MNIELQICILVVLTVLGIRGVLSKVAVSTAGAVPTMVVGYCLAPIMASVQLLVEGSQGLQSMPTAAFAWVGLHSLSSLAAGCGQLIASKGLDASIVVSVTASSVLFTQLLATFLGEGLVLNQVLGSAIIVAGVVALRYSRGNVPKAKPTKTSAISVIALTVSFVCFGMSPVLQKYATTFASKESLMLTRSLCDSAMLLVMLPFAFARPEIRGHLKRAKFWLVALAVGVTGTIATMGSYVALSIGSAGYVTALTQTFPVLTYVLAICFLNESFSKVRLAGILTIVTGGMVVR